ncbi:MAG: metallophosphoesterase, partial [Methylotenera sp.]|nr:metallophosphoesterase [Methylotenera sp.]
YTADKNYVPTLAATPADEVAHVLGQLKAPKGVYAVLGNHDWWREGNKMGEALVRQGIHVLENEATPLPGTDAWIVGIGDDIRAHANVEKALKALPPSAPALIAMHEPINFADIPAHINAISFAGHTHGGQVNIPFVGALMMTGRTPINWAYGWVHHNSNSMYVTSGLGVSMLPVRFNMRPEWVMFTYSN